MSEQDSYGTRRRWRMVCLWRWTVSHCQAVPCLFHWVSIHHFEACFKWRYRSWHIDWSSGFESFSRGCVTFMNLLASESPATCSLVISFMNLPTDNSCTDLILKILLSYQISPTQTRCSYWRHRQGRKAHQATISSILVRLPIHTKHLSTESTHSACLPWPPLQSNESTKHSHLLDLFHSIPLHRLSSGFGFITAHTLLHLALTHTKMDYCHTFSECS